VTARSPTVEALVAGVLAGDRRAVARTITLIENRDPAAYDLIQAVYPRTGRAATIGVTGPPGVGKSSLIAALTGVARGLGQTIGVITVDPSSPFTHGAILGDRIRLSEHFLDPGVFIRSMATRGHLGGLAEATLQAALVLDASGKDVLLLETVGAGQSEIEIAQVADTVLLVLMPGSGDSVQALKAGIMEIPDVIAVNKRDQPRARTMLRDVRSVLALTPDREWAPPIVLTDALTGEGVEDLWEALASHGAFLGTDGRLEARRRHSLAAEVFALASGRARAHLERAVTADPELRRLLEVVERRELDPLTAVREVLERVFRIDADESGTDAR
jgi:GTPase